MTNKDRIIKRAPCIGGCGTQVQTIAGQAGECRDCKRARRREGFKRVLKADMLAKGKTKRQVMRERSIKKRTKKRQKK